MAQATCKNMQECLTPYQGRDEQHHWSLFFSARPSPEHGELTCFNECYGGSSVILGHVKAPCRRIPDPPSNGASEGRASALLCTLHKLSSSRPASACSQRADRRPVAVQVHSRACCTLAARVISVSCDKTLLADRSGNPGDVLHPYCCLKVCSIRPGRSALLSSPSPTNLPVFDILCKPF